MQLSQKKIHGSQDGLSRIQFRVPGWNSSMKSRSQVLYVPYDWNVPCRASITSEKLNESADDRNIAGRAAFTWKPNRSRSEQLNSEKGRESRRWSGVEYSGCVQARRNMISVHSKRTAPAPRYEQPLA